MSRARRGGRGRRRALPPERRHQRRLRRARPAPRRLFESSRAPHQLALIANGSHTGFTGFASFFDPTKHYDRIGCAAIAGNPDIGADTDFGGLGDRREGIDASRTCTLPCRGEIHDPSLDAARHHALARIAIAAFFQARLRHDVGARCFLARGLERENPELTVRGR